MLRSIYRIMKNGPLQIVELLELPILVFMSLLSRLMPRSIDVGLGPLPMINNVYHKMALDKRGYSAETFVNDLYFITNDFDRKFVSGSLILRKLIQASNIMFIFSIFRYRCLYVYFTGGPLYATSLLWKFEPQLYRLAGVRTVVMPFGGDVQDLLRTPNLLFRHMMGVDYPLQRKSRGVIAKKIEIWTAYADHVISGCDWVDYMYFWDTLMLAHFSIDTVQWRPAAHGYWKDDGRSFRVLHAPNHKSIKGSDFFIRAVDELRAEGENIELILVQGVGNSEIKRLIETADVIADQLIIGWYAMFAIEAMAMGKPVICYLREDLVQLYVNAGLVAEEDIPLVNATPGSVKSTLRKLMHDRSLFESLESLGPEYVRRHHSIESVGAIFEGINKSIGLLPRGVVEG